MDDNIGTSHGPEQTTGHNSQQIYMLTPQSPQSPPPGHADQMEDSKQSQDVNKTSSNQSKDNEKTRQEESAEVKSDQSKQTKTSSQTQNSTRTETSTSSEQLSMMQTSQSGQSPQGGKALQDDQSPRGDKSTPDDQSTRMDKSTPDDQSPRGDKSTPDDQSPREDKSRREEKSPQEENPTREGQSTKGDKSIQTGQSSRGDNPTREDQSVLAEGSSKKDQFPENVSSQWTSSRKGKYSAKYSSTSMILLNNKYKKKNRLRQEDRPPVKGDLDPERHFQDSMRLASAHTHQRCFETDTPRFESRSLINLFLDRPDTGHIGDHLYEARRSVNPRRHRNCSKPRDKSPEQSQAVTARPLTEASIYRNELPRRRPRPLSEIVGGYRVLQR